MGGSLVRCKGQVGGACCQVVALLLAFFLLLFLSRCPLLSACAANTPVK